MGMFDFIGDIFGGGDEKTTVVNAPEVQRPDYAESNVARGTWGDTLQSWAKQPGYGAIQPDWNSIWENAAGKVKRYFNGGPEGPGLVAGVKSNLASRNMSEQPAAETQIANLGMAEGNQIQDMATQQASQQAVLGEQGRTSWLNSIMQLAGLKPSFSTPTRTSTVSEDNSGSTAGMLGQFGLGQLQGAGEGDSNMLSNILGMFSGPGSGSIGAAVRGAGASIAGALSSILSFI